MGDSVEELIVEAERELATAVQSEFDDLFAATLNDLGCDSSILELCKVFYRLFRDCFVRFCGHLPLVLV